MFANACTTFLTCKRTAKESKFLEAYWTLCWHFLTTRSRTLKLKFLLRVLRGSNDVIKQTVIYLFEGRNELLRIKKDVYSFLNCSRWRSKPRRSFLSRFNLVSSSLIWSKSDFISSIDVSNRIWGLDSRTYFIPGSKGLV